jgi:hypothetical protein
MTSKSDLFVNPKTKLRMNKDKKLVYINKSNIDIVYDDKYNPKNHSVLILSITNNILDYYKNYVFFIEDMEKKFGKISAFTGGNNFRHSDNQVSPSTHKKLLDHIKSYKNNFDYHIFPDQDLDIKNRIHALAEYRETVFEKAIDKYGTDFDYVIMFDTDTYGLNVDHIVKSLSIKNDWSCISGNLRYWKQAFYYDELALREFGEDYNIKNSHTDFDRYYGVNSDWIDTFKVFNTWLKVKAAFGGLSIYKTKELLDIKKKHKKLYDLKKFPKYTAEHIALCSELKENILISPLISFETYSIMEKQMRQTAFVPRDAGFFSVFNFLIGTISAGEKTYPYWNKEELLKLHKNNEHFAYWTDKPNCWFDYFEPISYFSGDQSHILGHYIAYPRYSGENCDKKFRIPKDTAELMRTNPKEFDKWRKDTHEFYKNIIKFKPEITDVVEDFWSSSFKSDENIIGVHYRHPSHFVESGKIYLTQYFDIIDSIIEEFPDTKIFLASDSQFGIYSFIEKYPDKVKYFKDIDRLTMAEFLEWSFSLAEGKADHVGFVNGKGFELHHKRVNVKNNKQMTIDLLKEVLCLSKCNQLVNTVSNIPLAISYINPEIKIFTL